MEIREAGDQDIPAIVRLLKVSLGESLLPKSEAYWRWKHVYNPFGVSPVLLAIENQSIVGVRAFMRWSWQLNGRVARAVRAVDTATHPDFQGKGIFSSLTKALLKNCADEGVSVVFNTPNDKSMPGYLKMGWETAGRLPVRFGIRRPLSIAATLLSKRPAAGDPPARKKASMHWLTNPGLPVLIEKNRVASKDNFVTAHSVKFLQWRYQDVPIEEYFCEGIETSGHLKALLIYRIKFTKFGKEMRITDHFSDGTAGLIELQRLTRKMARHHRADYVTSEGLAPSSIMSGIVLKRSIGPVVTIRELSGDAYSSFKNFAHWRPSVGDLELF